MVVNLKRKHSKMLNNEGGFSSIEAIALMSCFTLMVTFTFGVFGIIHSGILQSIGSRNYAFETFRHRTNLTYLRDVTAGQASGNPAFLDSFPRTDTGSYRIHFVTSESGDQNANKPYATERPIAKGKTMDSTNENSQFHTKLESDPSLAEGKRYNNSDGVNPAWIKVIYGICINAAC